jgi:hypothetical protein
LTDWIDLAIIYTYSKESGMEYTVIYPNGTQEQFHIRAVAELYASNKGGRVVGKPQLKIVDNLVDKLAA